ncbi:CMP/dCMP-type deaminase domain-containing protein [Aphelenchoides besseyi]|nr:CMP/dCMP-type deaminase domain-containing protein [Aphelenchoides besseyi]
MPAHIEPDQFLKELNAFYQKSRAGGPKAVTLTIKPYDGRTKPTPRPEKQPKTPPKTENLCLARAKLGNKSISTVIHAKEVNRFHITYMGMLKEHMDTLKRREKEKKRFNSTYHAEMVAIDQIYQWCQKHGYDYRKIFPECTLYVNLEPCCMCSSGLYQLRIKKVIFGAPNDRFGGMGSVMSNADFKHPHDIEIVPNVDVKQPVEMLKRFYLQSNPFAPTEKRKTRNKIAVNEVVILND